MGFSCHSVAEKEAQRGHKAVEVAEPTGGSLILWNEPFFKQFFKIFLLEYSCFTVLTVVYVSAVWQSKSAIHICIFSLFWISFPLISPQSIE